MNLKSKSVLIIAFLFGLKIVLIYLIFVQLNNNNKLITYIDADNENHTVLRDLTLLKDKIKTSQIVFSQYLCSQEAKDLKDYDSIIAIVACDLSHVQNKYINTIIYGEISKNKLLVDKRITLKSDSLLLSFDKNFRQLCQLSKIQSIPVSFDYSDVLQGIELETDKQVDTVKNKVLFSKIENTLKGRTDLNNETSNSILKFRFGKQVVTDAISKQFEHVLLASQKHYNNQFSKMKGSLEDIKVTEGQLIAQNQKITRLLTDLLSQFESIVSKTTVDISQKLLNQRIKDVKTRNLLVSFVVFLILLFFLLLFRYIYEIFYLEKKLKEANDQIQEDLMLKNKIISLLTHEIKTPINVIRMSSYLVSEKIQDQEVKEIFNSIEYTSSALALIANHALEVVKLGNYEELIFDISEFDISFEIKKIIKSLQVIAHSINVDLILHTNIDQSFMINYDRVRLYELLCNVIGNALKFANTRIDISVEKNNQTIFFEILDDGCGVKEEDLNHIFDLNYQGKKSHRRDTLSMGLGLYLCKRIIEKSNGTIEVSNSGSSGLKVVFSIDLTVFKAL
ncbi:sensor histidine kinase KdpD [Flavobacterium sp. LM4]|uniref:sensor histidine kinase n=1 Tax=Flavobacterium sp. LM4 TaxID=1938609 RepID=UPI00167072D1|nr:HAMP domain-containing sensor histidine kinase [Flavobacterium sp. LM4]